MTVINKNENIPMIRVNNPIRQRYYFLVILNLCLNYVRKSLIFKSKTGLYRMFFPLHFNKSSSVKSKIFSSSAASCKRFEKPLFENRQ